MYVVFSSCDDLSLPGP